MSLITCINQAKKWSQEHSELGLDKAEIEQMGRLLQDAQDHGATKAEQMELMNRAVMKRIEMAQVANRGNKYLNEINHLTNSNNIQKNTDLWGNGEKAPFQALKAQITGQSSKPGFDVNSDPLAMSRANNVQFKQYLNNGQTKEDLKVLQAALRSDDSSRYVTQEIAAMRNKTEIGLSGSDMAVRQAKGIREAQDAMFQDAKSVNPYLKESDLHLLGVSYNRELVSKVTQEEFVDKMLARAGNNLIGEPERIKAMLGETYQSIISGLPAQAQDMSNERFWDPQGTGGNQALSSARHKVFVFNDWQSEFEHNAEFGDSPYNAYVKQTQRWADYVATTTKHGTAPADNAARLFQDTLNNCDTPEQKAYLLKQKDYLKKKFDATTASRDNTAWNIQGRIAQALITSGNISKLLNHVPRTFTAGPAYLAQIRDAYGMNIFEQTASFAQGVGRLMGNLGDAGRSAMADMGVASTSVMRDMSNQLAAGNGEKISFLSKAARVAGKLTLADYATDAWKFVQTEGDTRLLGRVAGNAFDDLRPETQELLNRYNLGGDRWDVGRMALDENGRLTPSGVKNIPDDAFRQIVGNRTSDIPRIRMQIAQGIGTLLNERASMTVAESNSASRALLYGNTNINEAEGIVRNIMGQFKGASIVRQQLLARTFRSGGDNTSNWTGSMSYMLQSAFAGMVGQQLIELGNRRSLLDPTDPKIIAHMIESTGIAGFFGSMAADYMTSNKPDAFRRVIEGDMVGPAVGTVSSAAEAAGRTFRGAKQAYSGEVNDNQYGQKQWADLLESLTPGQAFYSKGALDYTLFDAGHRFIGHDGHLADLKRQMQSHRDLFGGAQQNIWGE